MGIDTDTGFDATSLVLFFASLLDEEDEALGERVWVERHLKDETDAFFRLLATLIGIRNMISLFIV